LDTAILDERSSFHRRLQNPSPRDWPRRKQPQRWISGLVADRKAAHRTSATSRPRTSQPLHEPRNLKIRTCLCMNLLLTGEILALRRHDWVMTGSEHVQLGFLKWPCIGEAKYRPLGAFKSNNKNRTRATNWGVFEKIDNDHSTDTNMLSRRTSNAALWTWTTPTSFDGKQSEKGYENFSRSMKVAKITILW